MRRSSAALTGATGDPGASGDEAAGGVALMTVVRGALAYMVAALARLGALERVEVTEARLCLLYHEAQRVPVTVDVDAMQSLGGA